MTALRHSLFVLTRDFTCNPTAQYLLRRALGACRRGCTVTVVLRSVAADLAWVDEPAAAPPTLLARLQGAGAVVLIDEGAMRPAGGGAFGTISDAVLTDLLLETGIEALWC